MRVIAGSRRSCNRASVMFAFRKMFNCEKPDFIPEAETLSVERLVPQGGVERSAPKGAVFLSYASPAFAEPSARQAGRGRVS